MVSSSPSETIASLREDIFVLLIGQGVSFEDAVKALSQCETHFRNRMMVEAMAKDCGLTLSGFSANHELELYYDLTRRSHDMGYISKGWEDPGFRIGDLIQIPKRRTKSWKAHTDELSRFCATNGIVMTVEEGKDTIELQMDGVIYSEGFNKETFLKTLETLHECVEKAQELSAR